MLSETIESRLPREMIHPNVKPPSIRWRPPKGARAWWRWAAQKGRADRMKYVMAQGWDLAQAVLRPAELVREVSPHERPLRRHEWERSDLSR